jgi:diguanylate cyclase (GGDEF)-like protein
MADAAEDPFTERRRSGGEPARLPVGESWEGWSLFEALLTSAPIGAAMLDRNGCFAWLNDALAALDGHPLAAHLGHRPGDLLGLVGDELSVVAEHVLVGGEASIDNEHAPTVRGEPRRWRVSAYPLRAVRQGIVGVGLIVTDVTRQREAEDATTALLDQQASLLRVAQAVAREVEPDTIFDLVAREAAQLLGCEAGLVARFDEDCQTAINLGTHVADGAGYAVPPTFDVTPGSISLAVLETGSTARAVVDDEETFPFRYRVGAPIQLGDRLWGLVGAFSQRRPFPAHAEERLGSFAQLVSQALGNADARRRLVAEATTDPLTGLVNRRVFDHSLHTEAERARRHGRPLSLVLLDLDHFKAVNDTHGHQVGDDVLREVARRLSEHARPADTVARVGGEELAWLLPETDSIGGWLAAERARQSIALEPFEGVGQVTVSAGVCDLDRAADEEELYRLADRALYWAKTHGRNVCCHYSAEAVEEDPLGHAMLLEQSHALSGVRALARAVDARDAATFRHSDRVAGLAERLAFASGWPASRAGELRDAAALHDVGKIVVDEAVLAARRVLTPDERRMVEQHPAVASRILSGVLTECQVSWVRHHHERWDGTGYPDGLEGTDIPDGALLLALAEAWDSMTSLRAYAPARSPDEAYAECLRLASSQFAPEAVVALSRLWRSGALRHREPF